MAEPRRYAKDNYYRFLDVKAFKGTVQLSGFVNSGDQKPMAGDITEKVEGVPKLENNITVKDKVEK